MKPICSRPDRTASQNGAWAAIKAKKANARYDDSNFRTYMRKLNALVEKIQKFRKGLPKVTPRRLLNDPTRP